MRDSNQFNGNSSRKMCANCVGCRFFPVAYVIIYDPIQRSNASCRCCSDEPVEFVGWKEIWERREKVERSALM